METTLIGKSKKLVKSLLGRKGLEPVNLVELRVQETINCRDCDAIPKVENAGEVNIDHNPPFQVMHNGVKVLLGGYHGEWMQRIITALKGHHEPQEEKVFYEVLKRVSGDNPVMLELGSYWAYYSLWFRKTFPAGSNYMVEPITEKMQLGQKNFDLNGFSGIFFNGCMGGEYKDKMTFVDWNNDEIEMKKYSVDAIVEKNNIAFIDILHSDIQGAEVDMLKGCEQSLNAGKIGYLCISTHGDKHERCLDFFKQRSMHIIAEHSVEASASADGLIVAQSTAVPHIDVVHITK
jgi:FkbM family methyltransferase